MTSLHDLRDDDLYSDLFDSHVYLHTYHLSQDDYVYDQR
ncbi:unnamed protein product [Haemonchus placei]|uniref:Transcriptional regulator n=1 Tax=Haemonchus placei TaxID=6290 RepID=A0A0N4X4S2_HAEPC|nr:unnamed protein product [Haemonchus placei]